MRMTAPKAIHEEPFAKVGQFHRLEEPMFRSEAAEDAEILPVVRAGFEIGWHGGII